MTVVQDELSVMFAALADPTRRAILEQLGDGDATVADLTGLFAITQQAVSKHLRVLERAGLISRGREAQARPCRLEPERLDLAATWIDEHSRIWADRHDRLDAHLASLRRANKGEKER
jgi:DNA-binding transcriptional ArsR family regulator